jgi:signal transduction histidine kinase
MPHAPADADEGSRVEGQFAIRIANHIPAMLAYWDRDLCCRFANHAYVTWFGVAPTDLLGTHIRDLLGPTLFQANLPHIEGALRGEAQEFERLIPDPLGGPGRHSLASYVPDVVDGQVRGFFVMVTNVTEIARVRATLQAALETTQSDVQVLASELAARSRALDGALADATRARIEAERAAQARTNLLTLVSHELRTPLTTIRLQLERLASGALGPVTDRQTENLARSDRAADRLLGLIASLLEFVRQESGAVPVQARVVELRPFIAEIVDEMEVRAERAGLVLECKCDVPDSFWTDPLLVRLIVSNLLDNAIKYTEKGSVRLSATVEGGRLQIEVEDTGPGIPVEMHEQIFEPFSQLDSVRQKHRAGFGVGLALVRRNARALGGDVELDSGLGSGTTFRVKLPALDQHGR